MKIHKSKEADVNTPLVYTHLSNAFMYLLAAHLCSVKGKRFFIVIS